MASPNINIKNKSSVIQPVQSVPNNETPKQSLVSAQTWLENYYRQFPLGGGWQVRNISVKNKNVRVDIVVPYGREPGAKYVGTIGCPNKHENVWNILKDGEYITLNAESPSGKELNSAVCFEKYEGGPS